MSKEISKNAWYTTHPNTEIQTTHGKEKKKKRTDELNAPKTKHTHTQIDK